jgi:hypothetical protein
MDVLRRELKARTNAAKAASEVTVPPTTTATIAAPSCSAGASCGCGK